MRSRSAPRQLAGRTHLPHRSIGPRLVPQEPESPLRTQSDHRCSLFNGSSSATVLLDQDCPDARCKFQSFHGGVECIGDQILPSVDSQGRCIARNAAGCRYDVTSSTRDCGCQTGAADRRNTLIRRTPGHRVGNVQLASVIQGVLSHSMPSNSRRDRRAKSPHQEAGNMPLYPHTWVGSPGMISISDFCCVIS